MISLIKRFIQFETLMYKKSADSTHYSMEVLCHLSTRKIVDPEFSKYNICIYFVKAMTIFKIDITILTQNS